MFIEPNAQPTDFDPVGGCMGGVVFGSMTYGESYTLWLYHLLYYTVFYYKYALDGAPINPKIPAAPMLCALPGCSDDHGLFRLGHREQPRGAVDET